MCYQVRCPKCGKTGWGGCGEHVDTVMASVPAAQRCTCSEPAHDSPTVEESRRLFRRWR